MLRSQFDSVWWLQSLADETCRVPEREMWHLGIVENKAGNIYIIWCVSIAGRVYGIGIAVTPVQIRYVPPYGIVAQLASASDFQSESCEFKSRLSLHMGHWCNGNTADF